MLIYRFPISSPFIILCYQSETFFNLHSSKKFGAYTHHAVLYTQADCWILCFHFQLDGWQEKTLLCVWHICKMYNYIKFAFVKGLIFKSISLMIKLNLCMFMWLIVRFTLEKYQHREFFSISFLKFPLADWNKHVIVLHCKFTQSGGAF